MLSTMFVTDDGLIFDPSGAPFLYNGRPSLKFEVSKTINSANHVCGHVVVPKHASRAEVVSRYRRQIAPQHYEYD